MLWLTWIIKVDEGQWNIKPPRDLLFDNLGETINFSFGMQIDANEVFLSFFKCALF